MGRPSPELLKFMEAYAINADEVWEVRTGGAWAIKHSALERVASEQKITFDLSQVIESNSADKIAVLCVTGTMGDRREWSIGEAAPGNCKNAYPFAMAEKRAKDRVILKLLKTHGVLYSEEEADDFKNKDESGKLAVLPKKDAKVVYTKLQNEIDAAQSRDQLKAWYEGNADRIAVMPEDWCDILRLRYSEKLAELRERETA